MTLNKLLGIDALTCALIGVLLTTFAPALSTLLALPHDLLSYSGGLLLPIAAFMAVLAWQARPWTIGVWLVAVGNGVWILASLTVLIALGPNVLGAGFLALQALVVAVLTMAEFNALARLRASTA